jgi:uncharacterized protein (DUF1778 family)
MDMRTQRLELRLTEDERRLDNAAATAVGETLSDFFRRAASARAQEVLTDQQQIALDQDEARRFLNALETVDQDTVARLRELREERPLTLMARSRSCARRDTPEGCGPARRPVYGTALSPAEKPSPAS